MKKIIAVLIGLLMAGSLAQTPAVAATFTVTPAVVSNTYSGYLTLLISNVPNGAAMVVQKYLDLNTNGVIDGTDWLVQQFNLTDGQAGMAIAGVTNFNVPGDLNTTTGAVTVSWNFVNGDFLQNIVGKYLFKLSSPSGQFTPVTNLFTVTNFPFGQNFTGNVVSNGTSTTLSNAVVLLFPPPRPGGGGPGGSPLAGVVANNAGSYTVQAPPGTYQLFSFRSNFLANMNTAPVLTLAAGLTSIANLTLTNATQSISGTNYDASNSSLRLPGTLITAMSTNGLLGVTTTDTNGLFTVRVGTGGWRINADDTTLVVHGYLGSQDGTNVAAGTTGVKLPVSKATALIYGRVKDNLGNPMVGMDVYAQDNNNYLYQTDGYTDTNGNYVVGVLGGLGASDLWWIQVSSDSSPTNFIFSQPDFGFNNGTNISASTAVQINFTALLATNRITGNVKDSKGTNIVAVGVSANATINGTNYQTYVTADTNGNYSLNVANGSWSININCNGGNDSLDNILGVGNYACPNNQNVNIAGNNATNNVIVQLCDGISIITTSPLPVGEVGVDYYQSIQAADCSGTNNWSKTGGTLPGGLTLTTNGQDYVLSGTPTNSGSFNFTVQVNNGGTHTTNRPFSVTISNALQITTGSLVNGTNGRSYSQQLQATGGQPPYNWSLASGSLPANLILATNGLLSGTLAATGNFSFTVQVTDILGGYSSQGLSLNVVSTNLPPLAVTTIGGQVLICWPFSAGTNFTVLTTTNLSTGPWVPATNGVPTAAIIFTNQGSAAFYKLQ